MVMTGLKFPVSTGIASVHACAASGHMESIFGERCLMVQTSNVGEGETRDEGTKGTTALFVDSSLTHGVFLRITFYLVGSRLPTQTPLWLKVPGPCRQGLQGVRL